MDYGQFKEKRVNKYCFHIKNKWSVMSGYLLNMYTMRSIIIIAIVLLVSSCASSRYYTGCDGKKKIKMINKW